MVEPLLKGGVLFDKEGRRRGRKHIHVPIARKTKLGVGPRRVICCSWGCKTLRTDAAAHCKRKGAKGEDWAALDLKTFVSLGQKSPGIDASASTNKHLRESGQRRKGCPSQHWDKPSDSMLSELQVKYDTECVQP